MSSTSGLFFFSFGGKTVDCGEEIGYIKRLNACLCATTCSFYLFRSSSKFLSYFFSWFSQNVHNACDKKATQQHGICKKNQKKMKRNPYIVTGFLCVCVRVHRGRGEGCGKDQSKNKCSFFRCALLLAQDFVQEKYNYTYTNCFSHSCFFVF